MGKRPADGLSIVGGVCWGVVLAFALMPVSAARAQVAGPGWLRGEVPPVTPEEAEPYYAPPPPPRTWPGADRGTAGVGHGRG